MVAIQIIIIDVRFSRLWVSLEDLHCATNTANFPEKSIFNWVFTYSIHFYSCCALLRTAKLSLIILSEKLKVQNGTLTKGIIRAVPGIEPFTYGRW